MTEWVSDDGTVRLIHGDCLEVLPAIERGSVDAVVCDPPYNAINRKTGGLRKIDKGGADSLTVDVDAVASLLMNTGAKSFYVWCSDEQYSGWCNAFKDAGLTTRKCAWWKTNPSPMNGQSLWLSAIELCVFARSAGATFNGHCLHPVWRFPVCQHNGHPTPKPVGLMKSQVEASSDEGDTVCDPFAGSGTTGVACVQTGRRFIGVELDEGYFEIAKQRIQKAIAERDSGLFKETK